MEEIEISSINYVSIKWTNFRPETTLNAESVDMILATLDCNKIKVHQQLMSRISPFFENILKEVESPHYPVIVLTDIQFPEIQAICEFLYNGEVLVPAERVRLLMRAADKLKIKGLANESEQEEQSTQMIDQQEESTLSEIDLSKKLEIIEINNLHDNIDNSEAGYIEVVTEETNGEEAGGLLISQESVSTSKTISHRCTKKSNAIRKEKKKNIFPSYPVKTATVATISSSNEPAQDEINSTLTTQVVPIVSTILIDNSIPISCEVCGVSCENERILSAHQKLHKGKYILYAPKDETKKTIKHLVKSCPHCPYASEHVTSLTQHIRTHTGEKPFKCDQCDKTFSRKTSLNEHMRCHTGERPFACDQCDKRFTQKHILANHVASIHSKGDKPFSCDYCDKKFTIRKALLKHLETHKLKSIRKRIGFDSSTGDHEDSIGTLASETEPEMNGQTVKDNIDQESGTNGRRGRRARRGRRKKLINELTASDFSEPESDPEFKCNIKLDSLSPSQETIITTVNESECQSTDKDCQPDKCSESESSPIDIRPTRVLPKRNAGKPRKSLSPSPPRKKRDYSKKSTKNKAQQKEKKMINVKKSDPINATDYYYYKKSYNIDLANLSNIHKPLINQEPEFIIEL